MVSATEYLAHQADNRLASLEKLRDKVARLECQADALEDMQQDKVRGIRV